MARTLLAGQGLITEVSRSHSDTPHSAGIIWTSDQPIAENSSRKTDNIRDSKTSVPLVGFEPEIPALERPQNHAVDREAIRVD